MPRIDTFFQTLYRTATPENSVFAGEYYQPKFDMVFVNRQPTYFVRETHGWWDEASKEPKNRTSTLSPEEGFATIEEAQGRYEAQVRHRMSEGFVHSFYIDPFNGQLVHYRLDQSKEA